MSTDKSTSATPDKAAIVPAPVAVPPKAAIVPAPVAAQPKAVSKAAQKKTQASSSEVSLQMAIAYIGKGLKMSPIEPVLGTHPYVSTGSTTLDMLIGGTPASNGKGSLCPGFPRRRITEVYGAEGSGKTTLALSAAAKLQKAGGSVLYLDYEGHLAATHTSKIGVVWDNKTFACFEPENFEQGMEAAKIAIALGVDLVVFDSVAAMVPADEMAKATTDSMRLGAVAALMAKVLPRLGKWLQKGKYDLKTKAKIEGHQGTAVLLLNQVRALISLGGMPSYGDAENTTGGKSLKFYTSLRIRLGRVKDELIESKNKISGLAEKVPYGTLTKAKIVKSKMDGTSGQSTHFFIRRGFGVDDYYSIIEAAVTYKLVKKEGARYSFEEESYHGRDKLRRYFIDNPKNFEALKAKIMSILTCSSAAIDPDEDVNEGDNLYEVQGSFEDEDDKDLGIGAVPEEVLDGVTADLDTEE